MNLDPSERRGPNILASRRAQLIAGCGLLFILVLSFGGHQHVKSASPDGTWSTYLSSSSSNRANAQQQQSTPSSGSVQQSVGYRHTKERVARANELYDESIVRRKALVRSLCFSAVPHGIANMPIRDRSLSWVDWTRLLPFVRPIVEAILGC